MEKNTLQYYVESIVTIYFQDLEYDKQKPKEKDNLKEKKGVK